jgi:hypothetical protein
MFKNDTLFISTRFHILIDFLCCLPPSTYWLGECTVLCKGSIQNAATSIPTSCDHSHNVGFYNYRNQSRNLSYVPSLFWFISG